MYTNIIGTNITQMAPIRMSPIKRSVEEASKRLGQLKSISGIDMNDEMNDALETVKNTLNYIVGALSNLNDEHENYI